MMHLVRIDIGKHYSEGLAQKVGHIVYEAMINEVNVAIDIKFPCLRYCSKLARTTRMRDSS